MTLSRTLSLWLCALQRTVGVMACLMVGLLCSVPLVSLAHEGLVPVLEVSSTSAPRVEIGTGMEVLPDLSRELTLEQVLVPNAPWERIDRPSPNFGFTQKAFWFRLHLHNPDAQPLERLLELPIPFLDDVKLYHTAGARVLKHMALGDEQPFSQRSVAHRNFIMPLTLLPGSNDVYLRLASSGTIEAPLRLWEPAAFYAASNDENIVQGAVIGILLIMVAYNLFVYFATRDLNYLYYICFVASYLLFHLSLTGYAFQYLWPDNVRWNSVAIPTFIATSALFTCLFTNHFLKLRSFSVTAFWVVRAETVLCLLLLGLTYVVPYSTAVRLGAAITIPVTATALVMGYWRWWKGASFARFYCVAWTAILLGLLVLNASKLGWIPVNTWTENASQIGIVLLVILLSFTLADQINSDRSLRLDAQAQALDHERQARASQAALIQATEDLNKELEQRVQSRTNDLNTTLQELQLANNRLQQLSTTDSLTQVHNRGYFDVAALDEWRRAERQRSSLTLMLLDIDHFKQINDRYGHPGGDAALCALAKLLKPRFARAGDIFARYGGEEFVIMLGSVNTAKAVVLAQELRLAISQLEIPFEDQIIRLTASFGLVCAVPQSPLELHDFVASADRALYQAKADGRNCVRIGSVRNPPPTEGS